MASKLDTNAKALQINLDPLPYGTFAEIGGGQEVSRWFFHVGGAAGTVAKTVAAYDKTVSDALYGHADRYVARERLLAMLDHEYSLLHQQLSDSRGERAAFFVFADTVATRSHEGTNECHGWVGVRFQHAVGSPTSDILIHVNLRDHTAARQQQTLGVLGVNLLFAALYKRQSPPEMLGSLMDGLSIRSVEVDVFDGRGPALGGVEDPHVVAFDLLDQGMADAVSFDERGRMSPTASVVHKRGLLLHRCSPTRDNPELDRMIAMGTRMLQSDVPDMSRPPLPLLELSLRSVLGDVHRDRASAAARVKALIRPGHAIMLTRWAETYEMTNYLRRYTCEPLRFIVGVDTVVQMLQHHFYHRIDGGLLEGLGRLLAPSVRVYAFAMPADVFCQRLELYGTNREQCRFADQPELSLADLELAPPVGRLLEYLCETGWIIPAKLPPPTLESNRPGAGPV